MDTENKKNQDFLFEQEKTQLKKLNNYLEKKNQKLKSDLENSRKDLQEMDEKLNKISLEFQEHLK